jgi:hypothetical protein
MAPCSNPTAHSQVRVEEFSMPRWLAAPWNLGLSAVSQCDEVLAGVLSVLPLTP